jgi:uncharacterized membrane protein YidH (DUF202 family)
MDTKQVDTNSATELAVVRTREAADRTLEAADRTLLAWIRTSLALIGFGFTANKVLSVLQAGKSASPLHSTLVFTLSFIALGTFGQLGAVIQYVWILKQLRVRTFIDIAPRILSIAVAILLVVIGLFTFIAVIVQ